MAHTATRPWDPATDTAASPMLPSVETFTNAAGTVAVSMWDVPEGTAVPTTLENRYLYEAWAERLCRTMGDAPCTGIANRSIPMCRERADCHPALIVPFDDDVFGYFLGNGVAVVWHGDQAPDVAEYGGGINLLKQFLKTRNVHTPVSPGPSREP